ncbi:MAG: hypothetical protein HN380_23700, partial [Victivallales bacterium]|nr:hypothetical protein [Victivallales bacterium]
MLRSACLLTRTFRIACHATRSSLALTQPPRRRLALLGYAIALLCICGAPARGDVVFSTTLNSAPAGWTVQGDWAFGQPNGTDTGDPASGHTGNNVYGVCLDGTWDAVNWGSTYYLTTTAIDCSNSTDVKLDFWRWLNAYYFAEMPEMSGKVSIEVSTNGGTVWSSLWVQSTSFSDTSWQHITLNVPAADGKSDVRFRWAYTVGEMPQGNWNIDDISITGTPLAPQLTNKTPAAGTSIGTATCNIDVTFSAPVVGVDSTDLVLSGAAYVAGTTAVATPTNQGGNTWRFPVSGLTDGTLNVSLAPDANDIEDAGGNDLAPAAWAYTVDVTAPTVTGKTPTPDSVVNAPAATIDVTFSESVGTLQTTDMTLSGTAGGSVTNVQLVTGTTYRFTLSGLGFGTLTVTLGASANTIEDAIGHDLASVSWSYTVSDTIDPTVTTIDPTDGTTVDAFDFDIDVTFSETVTGVDATDLVLTGTSFIPGLGEVGTPTNPSGNLWRFPVTGLRNGDLAISLAPDANDIEDAAGNDVANDTWSYTIEHIPVQKVTGNPVLEYGKFGASTAIDGGVAIVGATGESGTSTKQGAAYIYTWDGIEWVFLKKLWASDGAQYDSFGYSVAVAGDTVLVGAIGVDQAGGSSGGATYVFQKDHGGANQWGEVTRVIAPDPNGLARFGYCVGLSGDTAVMCAATDTAGATGGGSAYVFGRNVGGANAWGFVKKLIPPDPKTEKRFGTTFAFQEDTVVIGAKGIDNTSSAYLFERDHNGADQWGLLKRFPALPAVSGINIHPGLALHGDLLFMGDYRDNALEGIVHVYGRDTGGSDTWGKIRSLTPDDGAWGDKFGATLSVSDGKLAIGAPESDVPVNAAGAVYVFEQDEGDGTVWTQLHRLVAKSGLSNDSLGYSIAASGGTILCGVSYADTDGETSSGTAYFFTLGSDNTPATPDLLAASDTGVASDDDITKLDNDGTDVLQFSVSATVPGATVALYLDDTTLLGTATATSATTTIDTNGTDVLADGIYEITAKQTVGGTESPASPPLTITIDTQAPATPAAPDLQAASDSGEADDDDLTNDTTPTFDLVPGTGNTFRFLVDSTQVGGDYETGTTYTASGLSVGTSYNFNVAAINEAGTGADGNTPSLSTKSNM